jgi:alpha-L-rhamnosidase
MNSFNHYSLGSIGEWVYRYLAGIDQSKDSIAYEKVLIQPILTNRFEYVEASYESVRGKIASAWRRIESGFEVTIELPPGVTGELVLPNGRQAISPGQRVFTVSI